MQPKQMPKNIQLSKDQILNYMLTIFTFYAGKCSKYAYRELQEKYFMEMMADIYKTGRKQPLKKGAPLHRDLQNLYYYKGKKAIMDFKCFLILIPSISVYFSPELHSEDATKLFLEYCNQLYDSQIQNQYSLILSKTAGFEEDTKQFILRLQNDLFKLYRIYLPEEVMSKFVLTDPNYKSFAAYLELLKDFQIYPKILSASVLHIIYKHCLLSEKSNLLEESLGFQGSLTQAGCHFTFSKFIQSLMCVAELALLKLREINDPKQARQDSEKSKIKSLLEYMETVKSIRPKNKQCRYTYERLCLIVYDEYQEAEKVVSLRAQDAIIVQPEHNLNFNQILNKIVPFNVTH